MKTSTVFSLLMALVLLGLSACGAKDASTKDWDAPLPTATPAAMQTEAPTQAPTEQPDIEDGRYLVGDFYDTVKSGTTTDDVMSIEGSEEAVEYTHVSSTLGVSIEYDPVSFDYLSAEENDGVLQFASPYNDGSSSDVFFTVERLDDAAALDDEATVMTYLEAAVPSGSGEKNESREKTEVGGQPAQALYYACGDAWNSPMGAVYCVHADGRNYRIAMRYFAEAAEGYGARMDAMLQTLVFLERGE